MAATSKIEWCDSTFNGWIGCTKVSKACDDCYAARSTPARTKGIIWGPGQPRQRTAPDNWKLPVQWNREQFSECPACHWRGVGAYTVAGNAQHSHHLCQLCSTYMVPARRRVFALSLGDWLDKDVPVEWLADLLQLIHDTPNLDWLLLTKRIGNFWERVSAAGRVLMLYRGQVGAGSSGDWVEAWIQGQPPENVYIGITVIDQAEVERDVPKLLDVPATVRFLSVEPMLGPIDLRGFLWHFGTESTGGCVPRIQRWPDSCLHWVIIGGESGAKARPLNPAWVRDLVKQTLEAKVATLFKQWGEWLPDDQIHTDEQKRKAYGLNLRNVVVMHEQHHFKLGKEVASNYLDGSQCIEYPEVCHAA
jgi:protein gp37